MLARLVTAVTGYLLTVWASWKAWCQRVAHAANSGTRKRDLRQGVETKGVLPTRSAQFLGHEGPTTVWTRSWAWFGGQYAPPIVYLDDTTIMRAVDVRELRRGDHVCLPFNQGRCLFRPIDFVLSYAFCLEVYSVCHHTIIVDDVAYVDDKGVPRKSDGSPVMIFDLSNTVIDMFKSIWRLGFWPTVLIHFLDNLGEAMFIPLVEYGDTPLMLRMDYGEKTEQERDAIVERCNEMYSNFDDKKFNLLTNNCEHTCNAIVRHEKYSPEVPYMVRKLASLIIRVLPIALCYASADAIVLDCIIILCVGALVTEQCITFSRRMALGRRKWQQQLDQHDYRHLIAKEIGCALLNVVFYLGVLVAFWHGTSRSLSSLMILIVPVAKAMLSHLGGHLVMLLLFLASGSVWHFPPRAAKAKAM